MPYLVSRHPLSLRCVALLMLVLSACSESTMIRTSPPGATVYCDGELVGVSPAPFRVPRSTFRDPHTCRAELDGYAPATETLRIGMAPGRAVAAVFTLGIIYIFRSPYAFRDVHDLILTKSAVPAVSKPHGDSVDRLERLEGLRNRGALTEEEFQKYKAEIEAESR